VPVRPEPVFPCVGLCAGDGCTRCVALADEIHEAKHRVPGPVGEVRLAVLSRRVADVMGVRPWLTR
jgi:hypothetical protein